MKYEKSYRRKVLLSGGLYHIFHDSVADGMAVLLPFWRAAFQLSLTQVGLIVTCFESATALFQVPAGFLGERYGERRMLTLGTFVTAFCFMLLAFTGNIYHLGILLIVGGLGAGVQHPLAAALVSKAYQNNNRRIALGTYNFTGDMGKFLFPAIAAMVLSVVGWRQLCFGYGLIGLIITTGLYLMLRHAQVGGADSRLSDFRWQLSGWGITNKKGFLSLALIGFMDAAVRTSLITFLPFVLINKGMPMESGGLALSLLFIGGAFGKFACGFLAERIGIIPSIVITEAMTGLGILYVYAAGLTWIFILLPVLGMALNGTSSVLYGTVADFVSASRVPRAFSLFYTAIIVAAALAPPIFGWISDAAGIGFTIVCIGLAALMTLPVAYFLSKEIKT